MTASKYALASAWDNARRWRGVLVPHVLVECHSREQLQTERCLRCPRRRWQDKRCPRTCRQRVEV